MQGLKKLLIAASMFCSLLRMEAQSIANPILAGSYPDLSICRVGDDYYIVNSPFSYNPCLPIFHSKDLLNWQVASYALKRSEQSCPDGGDESRGLFASAISYSKGVFYIVYTNITKGKNFVVTAKDPKGPGNNPVLLPQVNEIDPSLFIDNNGKSINDDKGVDELSKDNELIASQAIQHKTTKDLFVKIEADTDTYFFGLLRKGVNGNCYWVRQMVNT